MHEALDTTTPGGRLVFHVFAALAEFIRELIVEGTRGGLDAARARGTRLGRPPAMTPEQIRHARDLLTRPENTVASIARLLGVSRNTIYKYLPEISSAELYPTPTYPPRRRQPHELIATPATAPAPGPRRDFSCRRSSRANTLNGEEPLIGLGAAAAMAGHRSSTCWPPNW